MRRDFHVIADIEQGGWLVRGGAWDEVLECFASREAAIHFACRECHGTGADVVVHDEGLQAQGTGWVLDTGNEGAELHIYEEDELPLPRYPDINRDQTVRGLPKA